MNAYSKELRLKTLAAIDRGIPRKEVQELLGVSRSTIKRWLKRRRQTGDVNIYKIPGRPSALYIPRCWTGPRQMFARWTGLHVCAC
jgi:transposase